MLSDSFTHAFVVNRLLPVGFKRHPGRPQAAQEQISLESLLERVRVCVCLWICVCLPWAKYTEGKVTQVERDRLKKVKRFNNNSKYIQEPKLAKIRSSRGKLWSYSYRQLSATRGKW